MNSFFSEKFRQIYRCAQWFYQHHLACYRVFRLIRHAPGTARTFTFRVRANIHLRLNSRRYRAVTRGRFISDSGLPVVTFECAHTLAINGPAFVGDYPFTPIGHARVELLQPALDLVQYADATVVGGTNYTLLGSTIVQPDACDMQRDVCPAEQNGIARVDLGRRRISLYLGKRRSVARAVSLLGCCTGNYAHWLTETLPKLLYVDSLEQFDEYPLLVDEWIHPNFVASLALLGKRQRQLIRVPRWAGITVASLVDVSAPAYVPPEHRLFHVHKTLPDPVADDFPMSRTALRLLRTRALQALSPKPSGQGLKLYMPRRRATTGNARYIRNVDEVEQLVKAFGYTFLDPATLTFNEQVALFTRVTHVVSPLGAALSNLLFAAPGCQVIGLSPYYEKANYYYFSNLMGVMGHAFNYVLGAQVDDDGSHPLHRDYVINIQALRAALEMLES